MYTMDNFMKVFKYYKSNKPKPSFSDVICFENVDHVSKVVDYNIHGSNIRVKSLSITSQINSMGLRNSFNWNIYSFINHPGLIFIRNPFTPLGQRYWIRKCLEEYTKKPNKSNLDIDKYIDEWWIECRKHENRNINLQKKLRWITLGYHHNWDTKEYSEGSKNNFPKDLADLCGIISKILGFEGFKAEAAIINYYHMGSTLSAHTDHSEPNLEAPLFSFSFGQSAIFLIGGCDKSIEPSAILINSGDIIIMSKEARLCYHAVPRILPSSRQPWNEESEPILLNENSRMEEEDWSMFSQYVEDSRININVRQVLNKNQKTLNDVI